MSGDFIPALRFSVLTRFYDPVVRLSTRERVVKEALITYADIPPNSTVLDLGCGTGTMTIAMKKKYPDASVIGLDADPAVLEIARNKASDAGVEIEFIEANATAIPFSDATVQRIVSSLFFHHLLPTQKKDVLSEALRILAPGGQLHVSDWGKPSSTLMRWLFYFVQLLDGFATTQDSVDGQLPVLMKDAGAVLVREHAHFNTVFGTLRLVQAGN